MKYVKDNEGNDTIFPDMTPSEQQKYLDKVYESDAYEYYKSEGYDSDRAFEFALKDMEYMATVKEVQQLRDEKLRNKFR